MKIYSQPLFHKAMRATDLTVTQSGMVKTDETWHQPPLYATESRLYFVKEGTGMLISDNEEMPLEAGYVYLAPVGSKCGFFGTPSVTKLYFHIQLRTDESNTDLFSNLSHFVKRPISIGEIDTLEALYQSTDPYDHLFLKGKLYRTVFDFIESERSEIVKRNVHSPAVTDAIQYIATHLNVKLTVREVAESCFCSQSKLAQLFKTELGQSVAKYIDDLILSNAKIQLLYRNDSIGKISDRLGFCDQFYFSRHFRNQFGIPPSEYRRKKE